MTSWPAESHRRVGAGLGIRMWSQVACSARVTVGNLALVEKTFGLQMPSKKVLGGVFRSLRTFLDS